jgi:GNAT superfamily N-acetyltransferase
MTLASLFKRFLWYKQKHGLKRLIWLSLKRLWEKINNKEVMFLFNLDSIPIETVEDLRSICVQSHRVLESIPKGDIDQLIRLKGKDILNPFLQHFFQRGATLWIAKMDEKVVGYDWTLVGGFDGFYSMPMTAKDAIILAVEVFPEFRGQCIASAMRLLSFAELRQNGVSRVFAKVHVANVSGLKSMVKNGSQEIGKVRTFKILAKHITIWDNVAC